MTRLQASLLGPFGLAAGDGRPVRIETRKARALFAVLVMARGKPIRRERLAGLLWSRTTTRQSLASLSQALYSLRRALEGFASDLIDARADTVGIRMDRLDVDALNLDASCAEDGDAARRQCLELYSGAFLDDLAIDTEEGYSEWRAAEMARLEGLVAQAGTRLMESWEHTPESAEMALVERLLSIDPYNEPAIRVRMALLAHGGRAAAAVEVADAFAATLSAELGIAPSDQFAELVARIRAGDLDPSASGPVAARPPPTRPRLALAAMMAVIAAAALLWVTLTRGPAPETGLVRLLVRPFEAGEGVPVELARGFSDDLSTALVRRSAIDVLSRESGRLVAAGNEAASGASHVLRGRVRGEGEQWVLNVWITETASGREVWAGRFSGSSRAPRDVRDAIVARITDGIGLELAALPEPARPALPEGVVPAYLGALSRLHSGTPEGNAEALARFAELAQSHPDAVEPVAGIVVAAERVAFEAADYARAAGLHALEGYLILKRALASAEADHPDILAARARLALRRLDHVAAHGHARQALELESGHVGALAVLSRSLALTGETELAHRLASRAVALSPAVPQEGYLSLGLAAFAEGDLAAARDAVEAAMQTARGAPLQLLALRAAILGLAGEDAAGRAAFEDMVEALESRPFGAWRIGDVAFSNPRAATWRRPSPEEAASIVRYADAAADMRFLQGIHAASGTPRAPEDDPRASPLSGQQVEDLLFNRRIVGRRTWIALDDWNQVRTADGELFQDGDFGPLPRAHGGESVIVEDRLCDRWTWRGAEIENCQLVMGDGNSEDYVLVGETGWFPFAITGIP